MKTLLVVSVLRNGMGVFTHKTTIDHRVPLETELTAIANYEIHLHEHLGNVEYIILVDNNEVFARWANTVGWHKEV
jgi:hypothetical protein